MHANRLAWTICDSPHGCSIRGRTQQMLQSLGGKEDPSCHTSCSVKKPKKAESNWPFRAGSMGSWAAGVGLRGGQLVSTMLQSQTFRGQSTASTTVHSRIGLTFVCGVVGQGLLTTLHKVRH